MVRFLRAWPIAVAGFLLLRSADGAEVRITSIAELRALAPEEAARALPVQITGVVTRCTHDELYLQEGAFAVYVWPDQQRALYQPGDYVEVSGKTGEGHFLPIVTETSSRLIGHGALPEPVRATYHDLESGGLDCRWVELSGIFRSVEPSPSGGFVSRLAVDGTLLRVEIGKLPAAGPAQLVGAIVRLRGVAGGLKNRQRQIVQPIVWVTPAPDTFQVESAPPADLFSLNAQAISTLMSYSDTSRPATVSKVAGQVLWSESPTRLFIRDRSDSLEVHLQAPAAFRVGDEVEVAGFAEHGTIKPILVDAFARQVGRGDPPPPRQTTVRRMLRRDDEADLVQVEAVVQDVVRTSQEVTFTLAEENMRFDVLYSRSDDKVLPPLPERGARISIVAICKVDRTTSDFTQVATASALSLRLRSLEDVHVISSPSWWSKRRIALAFSGLGAVLVVAGGWIWSLRRTVAQQTRVIITQTRAEATIEERDRIARELHDSLEQRLAGTTMLLDAAARAMEAKADSARSHLDTARAMLRHSLDEAQRAVLDLRSGELDRGDLVDALERSLKALVANYPVTFRFERSGERPRLDGVTENHLLRLAQEAVTNALKHAAATEIRVTLRVENAQLSLRIEDNGRGMVPGRETARAQAGQFGLIGMRERSDKMQAQFNIVSAEGRGTTIEITIPQGPLRRRTAAPWPKT